MKQFLLLCLAAMTAIHAQAQKQIDKDQAKNEWSKLTASIIAKQLHTDYRQKTTATATRLKAWANRGGGELLDSVYYGYSPHKGSMLTDEYSYLSNVQYTMKYFKAVDPMAVFYIQSDTSLLLTQSGSSMAVIGSVFHDFDASGNLTHSRHEDYDETYEYFVTNNSNGSRATVIVRDSAGSTPYSDKDKHYFVYDAQGRIILDSAIYIAANIASYKMEYFYGVGGNLDSTRNFYNSGTGWDPYQKGEFIYDASNRLLQSTYYFDNGLGAGWEASGRSFFAYSGTAQQYVSQITQFWDITHLQWEDDNGEIIELNANNSISRKYHLSDQFFTPYLDTASRSDYFYRPGGLYERLENSDYYGNGQFGTPDSFLYYYEQYETTGVNSIALQEAGFNIYPNPANNTLFIQSATQTEYLIYDLTGKPVMRIDASGGIQAVNVSALPSGGYFIHDNAGNTCQRFSIIH